MSRTRDFRNTLASSPVDAWAVALVVASLVPRGWALGQSWFWQDDFVIAQAARSDGLSLDYLFQAYNGHLMPAKFITVWALDRWAPLDWALATTVILLLSLAAGLAFWWALRTIFGPRRVLLVPLGVAVLCPILVVSFTWWSSALESLPLQITLGGVVGAHVRTVRDDAGRFRWVAWGLLFLGLLWIEKTLLVLLVLLWLDLLILRRSRMRVGIGTAAHRRLWFGYLVITASYLLIYTQVVPSPSDRALDWARFPSFLYESVLSTLPVGLLGGPWQAPRDSSTLLPVVPQPWLLLVWLIVGSVVVTAFRLNPGRAARGFALTVVYVSVAVGLVAATRLDFLGPVIGRDPRYLADVVPVMALSFSAAFLPVRGSREGVATSKVPERHTAALVSAVLVAYFGSAWITTFFVADARAGADARSWAEQALSSFEKDPNAVVYDTRVPSFVVDPFFNEFSRMSAVLGGAAPLVHFDQPTVDLQILDGSGVLQPADLIGSVTSGQGPLPGCGWRVVGEPVVVRLTKLVEPSDWVVNIGYYSEGSTRPKIDLGGDSWSPELPAGLHELSLFPNGSFDDVRISGLDEGESICVTNIEVGRGWPKGEPLAPPSGSGG